jgi:hypothetical protein
MHFQTLASSRLTPIKAPTEATNLMAARTNVGAGTGAKSGAATYVWRMVKTFRKLAGSGKTPKERASTPFCGCLFVRFAR